MKTCLSILCIYLLAIFTMSAQNITVDLDSFNELKVFDQLNVTLVKSTKNQAVISGDEKDDVKIVNDEGLLKIRTEIEDILDGNKTYVELHYIEDLNLVDANEGANILGEETIDSKYLSLRAQEGGEVNVAVNSRNLDNKAVTGGKITVSGKVVDQEVTVRTGGEYHGEKLKSEQTDVTVFAGGIANVFATDYLDANVTAGGTISVHGNPEKIEKNETFGGSIKILKN